MQMVAEYMAKLRAMGHEITHDWVATIRSVGEANPRDATMKQRARWSGEDLKGIDDADVVWVILPTSRTSFGCALEAGYAIGKGHRVIVSGDWRATIFAAQFDARFNEHDHALEWLRLYGTPGDPVDEMDDLEAQ